MPSRSSAPSASAWCWKTSCGLRLIGSSSSLGRASLPSGATRATPRGAASGREAGPEQADDLRGPVGRRAAVEKVVLEEGTEHDLGGDDRVEVAADVAAPAPVVERLGDEADVRPQRAVAEALHQLGVAALLDEQRPDE